ncbi:MAG TPA: hypothetical protein VMG59_11085 [Phycisphaerae bacterium]|nr:hypothetical protein [Phycisphaerae bacterium]
MSTTRINAKPESRYGGIELLVCEIRGIAASSLFGPSDGICAKSRAGDDIMAIKDTVIHE